MKCEDFQELLPDALGNELAPELRDTFEEHLKTCSACSEEFTSLRDTVDCLRSLPAAPAGAPTERRGASLTMGPAPGQRLAMRAGPFGSILRYAAVIILAFGAGYLAHASRVPTASHDGPSQVARERASPVESLRSFEVALAVAHARHPSQSDLAKCLIAMARNTN